jgi:hypothetical protein
LTIGSAGCWQLLSTKLARFAVNGIALPMAGLTAVKAVLVRTGLDRKKQVFVHEKNLACPEYQCCLGRVQASDTVPVVQRLIDRDKRTTHPMEPMGLLHT